MEFYDIVDRLGFSHPVLHTAAVGSGRVPYNVENLTADICTKVQLHRVGRFSRRIAAETESAVIWLTLYVFFRLS
jgi:hypothetical protein